MAVLSLTDLCARYVALLASQYQQPNAQRQIALFAKQYLADNFIQAVQSSYNLPGAQGTQLDVLGKYIGVTRFQVPSAHPPFFGYFPGGFEAAHAPANYQGTWVPATDTPTLPAASTATAIGLDPDVRDAHAGVSVPPEVIFDMVSLPKFAV